MDEQAGQDCGHAKCDGESWVSPNGTVIATQTCHHCTLSHLERRLKTALEALEEAQGKLEEYGNHIGPCKWRRDNTCSLDEKPCTCGFGDAILRGTKEDE